MNKRDGIKKVVEFLKQELRNHFVNADAFKYTYNFDEYGNMNVYAKIKNNLYYEFDTIYLDEEYNILQFGWTMHYVHSEQ